MNGRDPFDDLRDLAEIGERAARPSSPEAIRALGERRGRRRRVVAGAGALVAAVVVGAVGAGILTQGGAGLPAVPDPAGTPSVTAAPPVAFTEDNLPTEQDLEWHRPGDWKIDDTSPGTGSGVTSECLPERPESLGSQRSFHRSYLMGEDYGSATGLEFDSADAAQAAYDQLVEWGDGCEQTLQDRGHERTSLSDWVEVQVDGGEARYRVIMADQTEDPKREQSMVQEYGVIRVGNRVELVVLTLRIAEDHNWSQDEREAEETGLPLDPMIRSLPKAAARLAGRPVQVPPTPEPTARLTDDNLLRPGDLPRYDGLEAEEYDRNARPELRFSACFPESLAALDPTDVRTRSFRYRLVDPDADAGEDPDSELAGQPGDYTAALQFADEKAAERAYQELSTWVENCADTLDAEGFRAPGGGPVRGFDRWYPVRGEVETARFSEFMYQRADKQDGNGFFEAVGLVRVGDRIAVAVTVVYGMDHNWDADPEEDVAGPHPLADILPAAAERLTA